MNPSTLTAETPLRTLLHDALWLSIWKLTFPIWSGNRSTQLARQDKIFFEFHQPVGSSLKGTQQSWERHLPPKPGTQPLHVKRLCSIHDEQWDATEKESLCQTWLGISVCCCTTELCTGSGWTALLAAWETLCKLVHGATWPQGLRSAEFHQSPRNPSAKRSSCAILRHRHQDSSFPHVSELLEQDWSSTWSTWRI